jgi:hypothetical protein
MRYVAVTSIPAYVPPPVVEPDPTNPKRAVLSWSPPTQNTDGSALTNLAGFRVYRCRGQGCAIGAGTQVTLGANVTTWTSPDLASGTWFFAVLAYNSEGTDSALSALASKVIP